MKIEIKNKMILELSRTINMLLPHPENEPNSEFSDRIDSLIDLKSVLTESSVITVLPKIKSNEFESYIKNSGYKRIDDKILKKGKDNYCVNNVYRHFLNLIEFDN